MLFVYLPDQFGWLTLKMFTSLHFRFTARMNSLSGLKHDLFIC
jgi:hypothetical protein